MKLTDFKVLTFDVYGTLIDWESGMVEALKPLTDKVGSGLTRDDIEGMRSSTEPYARFMASTIRQKLRTSRGLCETGASGPSGNGYGDAAGHTCIAIATERDGTPFQSSRTLETGLTDREENMWLFAAEAMELLNAALD